MRKTFAYHKPSEDGLSKITELRAAFSHLNDLIDKLCPVSRERAVAITDLESSAMWSIKSVVTNDPKSEIDLGP